MKGKNLFLIVFAAATLAVGCNKEKSSSPSTSTSSSDYLPATIRHHYEWGYGEEVYHRGANIYDYEYDNKNRVVRSLRSDKDSLTLITECQYEYSSSGRLTGITVIDHVYGGSYRIEYPYEGNSVFINDGGVELVLDDRDRLIQWIARNDNNCTTNYYYDTMGNCVKSERIDTWEGETYTNTSEMTYDNRKGINSSVNTPSWFLYLRNLEGSFHLHHANNALTVSYNGNEWENYSYVYNNNGYPERVEVTEHANYMDKSKINPNRCKSPEAIVENVHNAEDYFERFYYTIEYIPAK